MKKWFWIFIVLIVGYWSIWGRKADVWKGFYYINGLSSSVIYSPEYKTKEDCISWAENEWKLHPSDANLAPQDLYECGSNCKLFDPNFPNSTYICEQNFDGGDWRRGDYGK
jgi:hypothetical protein